MLHWDGRRWHRFRVRGPAGTETLWLNAVAAIAADNVWFVATVDTTACHLTGETWGLVFRWNGKRWWRQQPVYTIFDSFEAVAARSQREVWIVDNDSDREAPQGGSRLLTGRHPKPSAQTQLPQGYIIEALATQPENVWAVGVIGSGRGDSNDYSYARARPLIERYGC
jgi:hypothetical protein